MDIRKDRFAAEAVRILQDVADSYFVAFDLEFSGTGERARDRARKPTLEENYQELRASVQQYQPLQIGLTIAKFDAVKGLYILEAYNFDISPLPALRERQFNRQWAMQSGAVSFLQRHGFDFSTQFLQGVPYLSAQEEVQARERMIAEAKREDMDLKAEDAVLVQHIRDSIAAWQAQPKDDQEEYLNIPNLSTPSLPKDVPRELNNYHKRLVHQIVQNEFPAMRTQGMGHFVQITNPTDEQQQSLKSLEAEKRERDLARAVGFRWVLDGITGKDISGMPEEYLVAAPPKTSQSKRAAQSFLASLTHKLKHRRKILIGHNCTTDILYLYKLAIGDLPEKLADFLDTIHDMFPAIIDTKFLASSHSERLGRMPLGDLEVDLRNETGTPNISTPAEFDRYTSETFYHEAGYDSYITAIVAVKLAAKLSKEGTARKGQKEEQENKIAVAAAESLPEFGVQDGYVTAAESASSCNSVGSASPQHEQERNVSGAVVAVKEFKGHNAVDVEKLRLAFSSGTIYDSLDELQTGSRSRSRSSSDVIAARMPGDTPPRSPRRVKKGLSQEDIDKMVVQGRLMPRWSEERAFWDVYGNRLQCNGTQEGVMRIV